jgi:hypothetical protein
MLGVEFHLLTPYPLRNDSVSDLKGVQEQEMNILFVCHSSMLHSFPSVDFTWRELNKESPKMGDWMHYYRQPEVWQHFHTSKNLDMAGLKHTLRYFLYKVCKVNIYGGDLVNTFSNPHAWPPKILYKFHGIDNEHATDCQMNLSAVCISLIWSIYITWSLNWTLLSSKRKAEYIK